MPAIQVSFLKNYTLNDFALITGLHIIISYLTFILISVFQPKHITSFIVFSVISTSTLCLHFFLYPIAKNLTKLIDHFGEKIERTKVRGYYNPSKEDSYIVVDDSPHKLSSKEGWGAVPETPWELDRT